MIGYLCGYLRYYYPLEFIAAYLKNANNEEDIINGTKLAKQLGINISPVRFRHSSDTYVCDKSTNTIYKSVSSIKFLNSAVAKSMYELRDKEFNSFVDYLNENPCDSRQTKVLILLDFFIEFGRSQKLLQIYDVWKKYKDRKTIRKEDLNIPLDRILPYVTEKPTQLIISDMVGFITELCKEIPNKNIPISELIEAQAEYLGYIDYVNPKAKNYAFIQEIFTKNSPLFVLYKLDTGEIERVKMHQKDYAISGLKKGQIIKYTTRQENKSFKRNGKWCKKINEFEPWISSYIIKGVKQDE